MRRIALALLVLALTTAAAVPVSATPLRAEHRAGHKITYDWCSLMIDGERVWLWSA